MICEVKTPGEIRAITTAAEKDGHACIAPTHYLVSPSGDVIGYASIGAVTPILFWSCTKNPPATSIRFAKDIVAAARLRKKPVVSLCTADSPFNKLMPAFQFELIGEANAWRLK